MTLAELNALPNDRAEEEMLKCCGSRAWVRTMVLRRPFASHEGLRKAAAETWRRLDRADWMEAFRAHPQIGQRQTAAHVSGQARAWSAVEQSGMNRASADVATELEEANQTYLDRFGYIFIVCASGKSAEEMLAILRSRLPHPPEREIQVAAEEQNKITLLRLERLLEG